MKESIITAALSVCSFAMLVVACVGMLMADREAPVITLEGKNNLTYKEGESYDVLLENMTAEDKRDGDVTESLRVSNLYVTEGNRAIVVYVAKDEANNIAKLKREIRYEAKPKAVVAEKVEEELEEEVLAVQEPETTVPETTTQESTTPETTTEAAGTPKVTMLLNEATLKVGETFNVLRYVQSAVDVDGTNLSRYVHADGNYDMSQPGTYTIRVYATSPNGGTSNIETFTLTVEQ